MRQDHVEMTANGRLVILARVRSELGIVGGGSFVVRVEDGVIKLVPVKEAIRRVQAELGEERQREAELE